MRVMEVRFIETILWFETHCLSNFDLEIDEDGLRMETKDSELKIDEDGAQIKTDS